MLVKVGPRGQITIPKKLRQSLNLSPGDSVAISSQNGHLVLEPVVGSIFDYFGFIPASNPPQTMEEMDDVVRDAVVQKYQEGLHYARETVSRHKHLDEGDSP